MLKFSLLEHGSAIKPQSKEYNLKNRDMNEINIVLMAEVGPTSNIFIKLYINLEFLSRQFEVH